MPLPFPSPEEMWTTALNELGQRLSLQSQKQPILFNHRCLLISRLWFPSVLLKFGGFSFVS